jgi:hypothetical protein
LGGIFKATDGVPFSATFGSGGDPAGMLSSGNYNYPNRLRGGDCSSAINPGNITNYIKTQCFTVPTVPVGFTGACNSIVQTDTKGNPVPAPSGTKYCANLLGNSGRNSLIGPGVTDLDFSLVKNNRLTERVNLQFRAEMFNILNHGNFAPPTIKTNTDMFDGKGKASSAAGLLSSTTTDSREMQFAIKFVF